MRSRDAGFTLLEVLIAFAIFSVVLVTVYGSLSTSLRGEAEAQFVLSSAQVVQSVMAEVGQSIPLVESTPTGQEENGLDWTLRIRRDGPPVQSYDNGQLLQLYQLELIVRDAGERTIEYSRTMIGIVNG